VLGLRKFKIINSKFKIEHRFFNFEFTPPHRSNFPSPMRIFRQLLSIVILFLILITPLPPSAEAASSAAIRAYDDAEVSGKDYSGQNLIQAEFSDAKLKEANFSGADLRGAVFNGAVLKNANLHAANFSDGIAYITDMSGVDLTDAILTSAMLLRTSFRDAKVTGADFTDAVIDRTQTLQLCKTASGVNPVTGIDTRESLGCP
jgi:Pentapeptide repeats (8 copies)